MHAKLPRKHFQAIDLLCAQTLCVFYIHWIEGTEVLLKLIFGLKIIPITAASTLYTYLCTTFTWGLSAPQASTQTSTAVCVIAVLLLLAAAYKVSIGYASLSLAADETATSCARFE